MPNNSLLIFPILRMERVGRGGKTVTVIERLPRHETFVSDLAKRLKMKCGSGGTYRMTPEGGVIEIQGDKREQIRAIFGKDGISCKG
ncbi:MAG TPA: translation initiation factor [Candidatus Omnitrophota bacterium]|nr:translation initiation factor [Candidatus Omnitrophota bacterium]